MTKGQPINSYNNPAHADMVNLNKTKQAFFDAHAQNWNEHNYPPRVKNRIPDMIRAFKIKPGSRVLDAGCGQGVLIPYLRSEVGDSGHIIALDSSAEMLKGASAKDCGRTTVIKATAEDIPLIDDYLDTIICFSAFPHFSDKEKAASEFFRILRPGGVAFIAHFGSRDEINAHHSRHVAVAGDHLPCPAGMNKIFTSAGFAKTNLEERPGWYFFSAWKE